MGAGLADSDLFGSGGEGWVLGRRPRRMGGYARDLGSGRRNGGEDFLAESFEEVVNDPRAVELLGSSLATKTLDTDIFRRL